MSRIRIPYYYSQYKDFPEATAASKAYNRLTPAINLLLTPVGFVLGAKAASVIADSILLLVIFGIVFTAILIMIAKIVLSGLERQAIAKALIAATPLSEAQKKHLHSIINGKDEVLMPKLFAFCKSAKDLKVQYINGQISNKSYISMLNDLLQAVGVERDFLCKDENIKEYCFEDVQEYNGYQYAFPKEKFHWLRSNDYIKLLEAAIEVENVKNYSQALTQFRKALAINPVGYKARFEIVNCLIQLDQPEEAKKELYEITSFLPNIKNTNKSLIAKFYRRLGFIYTELGSFQAAYACYKYSLNFEELDYTYDEMYYISSNYGIQFTSIDETEVFKEFDILMYTKPSLDY